MLEARNRVSCDSYRLVDCSDVTHSGEGGVLGQGMLRMLSAFFGKKRNSLPLSSHATARPTLNEPLVCPPFRRASRKCFYSKVPRRHRCRRGERAGCTLRT